MRSFLLLLCTLLPLASTLHAALEREQLAIEREIKNRIEDVLSKTLPANGYLVTVKVEMEDRKTNATLRTNRRTVNNNNPFLDQNRFILPGVPVKKELTANNDSLAEDTVVTPANAESLIRRVLIKILVPPDIPSDQIRAIQDLVTANIPFNPLRGDEIDIQNSTVLKPAKPAVAEDVNVAAGTNVATGISEPSGTSSSSGSVAWWSRVNWPVLALLGLGLAGFLLFLVFLFGPVRGFLNRLLAVLPRVGEQAAYAVNQAPAKAAVAGSMNGTFTGTTTNGHHKGFADGVDMPFRFVTEETVRKLPILLRQMPANQTAVVLAYLPPEWASQILNGLDAGLQTAVVQQLALAREIPSEIVKDIESQVKSKLPYLVGGTDWVQSVYQLTQPQTQKALLGTLNQQAPELAQTLRRKSFFYEDLLTVAPGSLRIIIQDVGYPVMAQALKEERSETRQSLLARLPAATREILEQELEVAPADPSASADAKERLVLSGRRLLSEGRIALPEKK